MLQFGQTAWRYGGRAVAENCVVPDGNCRACSSEVTAWITKRAPETDDQLDRTLAVGGARDREASRGGCATKLAALSQCSTRWKFAGTSSCGGGGANALDAKKIDAQIAQ